MEGKKPIYKRAWFWVIIVVLALGCYGSTLNKEQQAEENVVIEATAEPTTAPTAEPTEEPTAEPTVEPTTEPTAEPTTEPTAEPTEEPTAEPTAVPTDERAAANEHEYVLNTSTMKFHLLSCASVDSINPENKKMVTTTRDKLIDQGYDPCKICDP